MAYFAELDTTNLVVQVLSVADAELMDNGVQSEAKGIAFLQRLFGHKRWIQTSFNGTIRKNYAGIGYQYDAARNAFIAPRPEPANFFTLDEITCRWQMTPEGAQFYITEAVKSHLDFIVFSQRQYDNIGSCISYETDPDPLWAAEAVAAKVWRSAVWKKVIDIQTQVQSGQRPIPTPTEVIAELPLIQWPA